MALKAKIDKTAFEGLSDELKTEYKEVDGSYILNVTPTDGLALEDISGLKRTVETLRMDNKGLTNSVKAMEQTVETTKAKYAGIDIEQARDAISKIDEIKNWKGEEKVAEAVKVAEAKFKAQIEELNTKHKAVVEELTGKVSNTENQLRDAIVTSKITEAIAKEKGNLTLLLPHVKSHVKMTKDSSGKFIPEVIHDNGTPRIGDNAGNPMTIDQLVAEMKGKDEFAGAFAGVNATGPGNKESQKHKTNQTKPEKTVSSTDQKAMSDNLESIAAGKVQVNMDNE